MAIKVIDAVGSNSETYSEIDIVSELDAPKRVKDEIKQAAPLDWKSDSKWMPS